MGSMNFCVAYDKVMARWPADREEISVRTAFGETVVNVCGPRDGIPLLLLPGGGGATSASWFANTAELARTHRVHAVDLLGEPGRSVRDAESPLRTVEDLTAWLDELIGALLHDMGAAAATRIHLGGHSYGGWIALQYALHAPERVSRLFLLDPTKCFAGFGTAYLLRAGSMMLRRSPRRLRAFLEWETGGVPLDHDWLRLQEEAGSFPLVRPVTGPAPEPDALRALDLPVLVLFAERSRAHDARRVAARAATLLPHAEVTVLPDVSHHALPHTDPAELNRRLTGFLTA
ncbi:MULTISPECIES: alpha/beta hydrolase [unclassified Streptomyces]|uniref:alpha/beta fold hydrolase n=1 Tax=unclassified Streptomyces TaxID=2593676 RepID=UPI0033E742CA